MDNQRPPKDQGLTLIEAIVIAAILIVLIALFHPFRCDSIHMAKITACANNLSQLYKMSHVYKARYGHFPTARGSEYWRALLKTDPPLIEKELQDLFFCPMRGDDPRPGATDYRGQAFPAGQYTDNDPIGADLTDNHDEKYGINVIRPARDVQRVYRSDLLWAACDARLAR